MQGPNGMTVADLTDPARLVPELRDYWTLQQPSYSDGDCCLTLAQNFESLVLGMKVQNRSIHNPASVMGKFNDKRSVISLEYEGASTTCLRILPDQSELPVLSGIDGGVEILLDLETFDNAHLGITEDALKIMVTDQNDYPLLDQNGFTIKPGVSANIKIRPVLFDTTEEALAMFSDVDRRCVDSNGTNVQKELQGMELPYSLSNCLMMATLEEAYSHCSILPPSRQGLMNATGPTLYCLNSYIAKVGRWQKMGPITCLDACHRQENKLFISESQFPNNMFAKSSDFYLVLRKLWWSCQPGKNKFGPKREILDVEFPNLCRFYDDFVYKNKISSGLLNDTSFFPDYPVQVFLKDINMTATDLDSFKKEVLAYSRKNLIKITAYIEKVFAAQYVTDQASAPALTLL